MVPPFDLTPMIDVVLQLIIFFLFTSQFGELVRTDIDLPEETGEITPAESGPDLIVDIGPGGVYLVESTPYTLDEIQAIARAQIAELGEPASLRVLLRPDRHSPARHLNQLTQRLAQLGIRRASIGTVAPSGGGATP